MTTTTIKTVLNKFPRRNSNSPRNAWSFSGIMLAAFALIATALPAHAVTRDITITAPSTAPAGSKIAITVAARTDAGGGERVGFFHSDYSTDSGVTWTAISYSTSSGSKASFSTTCTAKEAGSKVLIRVRVAYRGGKAGDVDYTGKPIQWDGSWNKWKEPPAKIVHIDILAN